MSALLENGLNPPAVHGEALSLRRRREGWADVTWEGKDNSYAKLLAEDGSI